VTAVDGHAPPARGTVLVTDAELGSALAVVRSLGRAGWRVVAASSAPRVPAFSSRWTARSVRLPAGGGTGEEAEALLALVVGERVDVLVPVTDATLLRVDAIRDRLPAGCVVASAPPEAVRTSQDKVATLHLAAELGIPVPDAVVVRADGAAPTGCADAGSVPGAGLGLADVRAGALGWPVVVKPQWSRVRLPDGGIARCTTSYAFDASQLADALAAAPPGTSTLLQRYHAGVGVGVCLLTDAGRPLAAFAHQRLREVPPSGGVSALRESVPLDPQLDAWARTLLAAMDWTGLAMVEFKVDRSGPVLMEVNGRIWGSLPLATRAGMDFPRKLVELVTGGDGAASAASGPVDTAYRLGVRSRQLRLELDWIEAVVRQRDQPPVGPPVPRRAALGAVLSLLRPDLAYDGLVADDVRPALVDLVETLAGYRRRLSRRRVAAPATVPEPAAR
jgi:predicted ATP-grasp superfamily ATP-dependent carboligase